MRPAVRRPARTATVRAGTVRGRHTAEPTRRVIPGYYSGMTRVDAPDGRAGGAVTDRQR
ncbi:hypothetical protein KPATCC21470_1368 [Kitasatospora purpeofusca]